MGADLVVRHEGKVIVIQCKRYAAAVGVQAVQEVLGARCFYEADEAWVITDSIFTEAARKLAKAANVRLRQFSLRK
jgi:restriction system protein